MDASITTSSSRPVRIRLRLVVLLAGPVLAGCGAGTEPASTAVRDSVHGMPRLTYGIDVVEPLGWHLDSLLVIGDVTGSDDQQTFGGSIGLAPWPENGVAVLDPQGDRVLAYDGAGRFTASFGRPGRGPGELDAPTGLATGRDTVWVLETNARRVTGFPMRGGEPRVFTLAGGVLAVPPLVLLGSESGSEGAGESGFLAQRLVVPSGPDGAGTPVPIVRLDGEGEVLGEVWRGPTPAVDPVEFVRGTQRFNVMVPRQLAAELRWGVLADRTVVVSDTADYRLTWVRPDGTPVLRVRRDAPARPTTEADRSAIRARIRSGMEADGTDPGFIDQRVEKLAFADVVPWITRVGVDSEDRIWVGVSVGRAGLTDRVDVYGPDGRYLGSLDGISVPDVFLPGGRAATVVTDPGTGVQLVTVLRLVESPDEAGARSGGEP